MKRVVLLRLSVGVCLLSATQVEAAASPNLIVNGSFESLLPRTQPEWFYTGDSLVGWLVGGPAGAYVSLNWDPLNAEHGNQYVAMTQTYQDDISQVVDLQAGSQYLLQFYVFAATDQHDYPQSFQVDVVTDYPASTLENSRVIATPNFPVVYVSNTIFNYRYQWLAFQTTFTALADEERLTLRTGPSSTNWFALDDVSLVEIAVPEPSLFGLLTMACCTVFGRRFMHPRV